ncbi:PAS domain-containing protein, partial [Almyronema epifaneia]
GDRCPPIVVIGSDRAAFAVQALKQGAIDYLAVEQLTPERLQAALQAAQPGQLLQAADAKASSSQKQQSERQLRRILDSLFSFVGVMRPDGVLIEANQTALAAASLQPQEVLGLPFEQTYWWSYSPAVQTRLKAAIARAASGEVMRYDVQIRLGPEQFIVIDFALVPLLDEQGQVEYLIPSGIDVTDRIQSEISLRQSQTQLQQQLAEIEAIYRTAPIGLAVMDRDLRFVQINQQLAEMNGASVEAHIGRTVRELLPDLADTIEDLLRPILATGEPLLNAEIHGETPAQPGTKRVWLVNSYPLKQDDQVTGLSTVCEEITERKQAENALRESEERFRTLADNISQFAWMADENGWIFWYNQRWFDYTGTTLEQMQGWGWRQVHHPDHVERVVAKISYCFEQGELWEDTFPLRSRNGEYRWFLSRAIPIRDQQGNVLRWFGTNTDITELRQAEIELKQTTERLNIALKSAPITLFNQDLDLRYTWVYNPTERYSVEEMLGRQDADLVAAESAAYLTQLKRQVLEAGVSLREEVTILRNQEVAYYDLTLEPLRNAQNQIVGITGAAVDTSQKVQLTAARRQAQADLRQSEDRLRMALEAAQLGTWDWNLTTNELIWDAGCKAIFGLPEDATVNIEVFYQCLLPEDSDRMEQIIQWALNPANGGDYDAEYRIINFHDRAEHWVAAKGQVYFNAVGQPQRFTGVILDITEQKQAEAEREQLLQREQAARESAERANRIKDEFLAVLSHELRSPLNPILGWTKLLQTRKLDAAKTAKALETIERNTKLQTQLIDDLLDIAKILRGKLSLNVTAVNLSPVIEAAIETLKTAATAKSITITPILLDRAEVSGDAGRLQQIIWNLLSNAVKFTPSGGQVEVLLQQVDDQAQITVRDTGKGISADFLPYIFESFRQEDFSTTRNYGGLGLGLAIVRQLVEAHGGTIAANSSGEGLGAIFTVSLPLLNSHPDPVRMPPIPAYEPNLRGIRVLTVDDEPDARELLTVLLSQYGAEVKTVTSAAEVLETLSDFDPDVLVSDIGMPGVDGYTLIQQIRALPADLGGLVPAIALTAYAREEDYQQAIASGYQRHISKPVEPLILTRAIQSLVPLTPNSSDPA